MPDNSGRYTPGDNSGRYTPGINGSKHGYVKRTPQHYEVHSSGGGIFKLIAKLSLFHVNVQKIVWVL